jgi:hypothetical protein
MTPQNLPINIAKILMYKMGFDSVVEHGGVMIFENQIGRHFDKTMYLEI